jgi:hypothetical protein
VPNEDFACVMAVIAVHAHAPNEHALNAFLETSSEGIEKAVNDAAQQHGVEVVELSAGGYDDEAEGPGDQGG